LACILHRLDNIEKELVKANQLETILKELAKSRTGTAQLQSELQTFSRDMHRHLEKKRDADFDEDEESGFDQD
jgi:biopolymer transport protein ExbB/TolQ